MGLGGSQGGIKWNCRSFPNKQFPTISNFAPTAKAQLHPLPFLPKRIYINSIVWDSVSVHTHTRRCTQWATYGYAHLHPRIVWPYPYLYCTIELVKPQRKHGLWIPLKASSVCMHVCMCMCVSVCMCVCKHTSISFLFLQILFQRLHQIW